MAFSVKVKAWALAEGLADSTGQVGMRMETLFCSRPRCTLLRAETGSVGLGRADTGSVGLLRAEAGEGDMMAGEGGCRW